MDTKVLNPRLVKSYTYYYLNVAWPESQAAQVDAKLSALLATGEFASRKDVIAAAIDALVANLKISPDC